MLATILGLYLFLAQAPANPAPSQQQQQMVTVATHPPTSQQSLTVVVNTSPVPATQPAEKTIKDAIQNTEIAQILSGQKPLELNDVKNPYFWFDTAKDFVITILAFIPRLLGTVIFLLVFWLIYRGIRKLAVASMKKSEVDTSIRDMLATLIKWIVMGFGVVIACNQLGIPIVAMLTGVSIIGLAVGFAAQETLANFIAGIVIFLDKPFKVGDWVAISSEFGQVRRVTFRSTRLLTLDGDMIIFPNTQMLNNKVANHSTNPMNRVSIPISIAYKESIDKAREALLVAPNNDPRICRSPAPEVVVHDCADSGVNLKVRFWIEDESIEHRISFEILEKSKKALDAAGIEIPYPHMQLFLENSQAFNKLIERLGDRPKS